MPGEEDYCNYPGDCGAVRIVNGSSDGLTTSRARFLMQGRGLDGTFEHGDRLGASLTAWNWGNGAAADLAIGVPSEDVGTIADAGALHVVYGGTLTSAGQQLFTQDVFGPAVESGDGFGSALY